jgi:hypothetical protein
MNEWVHKNGFRYTDENAHFLSDGGIIPKVCPYCKCEVERPETSEQYLDEHEECFPM